MVPKKVEDKFPWPVTKEGKPITQAEADKRMRLMLDLMTTWSINDGAQKSGKQVPADDRVRKASAQEADNKS